MSNVSDGTRFENDLIHVLGDYGFWVSSFPKANDGSQPADIIAMNHKGSFLIDAKVCSKGRFVLSRMEENQVHAMLKFAEKSGGSGWFALSFPENRIYMLPLSYLLILRDVEGKKSISDVDDLFSLEYWLYGARD